MDEIHKSNPDEEEDVDLDALRLAALQSLKKKSLQQPNNEIISPFNSTISKDNLGHFSRGKAKRGKFISRPQQNRISRNGQFNNGWARNSNLISVPMVSDEKPASESPTKQETPKLILPQDRYCNKNSTVSSEKSDNASSKFDRYNNSDESDSDSDEDRFHSDEDELKPSNSLENLMAELENEIQGSVVVDVKKDEKIKAKPKKKRKLSEDDSNHEIGAKHENAILKENLKPELKPEPKQEIEVVEKPAINTYSNNNNNKRKWMKPPRKYSSVPGQGNFVGVNRMIVGAPRPPVQEIIPVQPYPIQNFQHNYNVYNNQNSVYVAPPPAPMMFEVPPPPVYERPLSPIGIKTDFISSANTLAPLSPRSAAFVLQNRAIIEKRKRRSYSRSPSPRFTSKSPKRFSLSPKRPSKSPPPSKRRSLSPSPVRKVLPPRNQSSRKQSSVHDRLGIKTQRDETTKKEKVKEEEEKEKTVETTTTTTSAVDPVLEARRRKFERSEINLKGGVIRLKTTKDGERNAQTIEEEKPPQEQVDEQEKKKEIEDVESDEKELEFEDTIELLEHTNELLFSDEESDSDNEGRFKTKQENNEEKVQILPFRKLVNGCGNSKSSSGGKKQERKTLSDEKTRKKRHRTSRSPTSSRKVTSSKKSLSVSSSSAMADSKVVKHSGQSGIFQNSNEKKIEIKIRNSSKYEREKKSKSSEEKSERKVVEIQRVDEDVVETVDEAPISSEGDLRAQLSRKRAERQKHPAPEVVLPTRLLRNALQQSVGLKKTTKAVKDETVEGKLPIHLRLGSTNSGTQSSLESSFGKKSRKHTAKSGSSSTSKSKGTSLEQV